LLTLVLVLSFSLVTAVPAAANGTTTTLTVPDNVYRPAEFVESSTTTNLGTAYDTVRFNITMDGPVDFTGDRANTFTITKVNGSSETQGINDTFILVGGNWVGYWGPGTGFPLTDGYDATSTFTIEMCDVTTAPLGNYDVTVDLVDLNPEPDVTLATATDSFSLGTDTLYVGTTQYQYQFTTIQTAIDAASDGDTINVAAGTYEEAITIDKELTLLGVTPGVDKNSFTLPGTLGDYDDSTESVIKAPTADNPNAVTITSSNVTFQGFIVEALNRTESSGNNYNNLIELRPAVTADGITNIIVKNNVVGPNMGEETPPCVNGRHGIRLSAGAGSKITNTTITGNKVFGTYGNGNNIFVWGTNYYEPDTHLISDLTGTVIENNDISDSARSGIELSGAQNGGLVINNNRIYSNGTGHTGDDTNLKYGNGITLVRDYIDVGLGSYPDLGHDAGFIDGATISNNEIYNNDKNGIYFGPMSRNIIVTGNDIHGNGYSGRSGGQDFGDCDGFRIDLTGAYYYNADNPEELGSTSIIVAGFNNIYGNVGYGAQVVGSPTNLFELTATENWWGDISGPQHATTNPGGLGDEVSNNVDYTPWLTREFQTVLDDNIAYYGFPMVEMDTGWNIFSTPVALDPACDTWGEYVALGDGLAIDPAATTYYFDNGNQVYGQVLGNYQLKSCDAIYVKMAEPDISAILYSPNVSVPSKNVYSGWNLIGLANLDEMSVENALISIEIVPGDFLSVGYSMVVSPPVNQDAWTCPPSGWETSMMQPTKGYWVFMINDGTLAGFTFTPMSLD